MDVMNEISEFLLWQQRESIFPTLGLAILNFSGWAHFKVKWIILPIVASTFLLLSFALAYHFIRVAQDWANR